MSKTITISTEIRHLDVDVEVDLGDIDTDDLLSELKSRKHPSVESALCSPDELESQICEIYRNLSLGNKDAAINVMRAYIENITGRILP